MTTMGRVRSSFEWQVLIGGKFQWGSSEGRMDHRSVERGCSRTGKHKWGVKVKGRRQPCDDTDGGFKPHIVTEQGSFKKVKKCECDVRDSKARKTPPHP